MKKLFFVSVLLFSVFVSTSFDFHKFYMGIYQVNFVPAKKRIEITARLFVDDLNVVLEKKYNKKTALGLTSETVEDEILLKKYLSEHLIFTVNGIKKSIQFVSKELDNNVLVCYLKVTDVPKINTLEIQNDVFVAQFPDQQNLVQSTIYGEKKSVLLTDSTVFGMLK